MYVDISYRFLIWFVFYVINSLKYGYKRGLICTSVIIDGLIYSIIVYEYVKKGRREFEGWYVDEGW
ncbi:MAG: hypothetical protein GF364_05385 [Candidatus Lokiarchaeota archaeon]|nr:hypothetical protein [Candidatus Lokiarchaeota archaeon]